MSTERFPYSPLPERPPLTWPGNARVAVWVLPNIEHYEYQPALINDRDPWPRMPHPDVMNYGVRDYGNRVGVWRMFDCLDRHNIRATISLNFSVIEHYPEIWEAMEARQCDYLCHGLYNTTWRLTDIDNHLVAPMFGFKDSMDYYTQSRINGRLHSIKACPKMFLQSWDDVLMTPESFPIDEIK